MCLVTIGLPVYNAAPFLADAIQSVLNQTLTDWELLIVDDGSTDSSMAVAESFTDPRIRLLTDGINRGLPARLNQISRLANGTYLARMDADDLMTPDRLQTQFDCMIASPGIDLVGAFAYVIDTRNQVQGIRGITALPATGRRAAGGVALIHPTVLARTDWFRRHPYRENCRRAEDYDLWLRTVETSVFYVIDQPLLFYREAGLPLRRKYSETAADVRKILCRLPRTTLSVGRFWQLLCLSYSKEIVYGLFALTGRIDWLMQRRNRPLTVAERHQAQAVLSQSVQSVVTHKLIR